MTHQEAKKIIDEMILKVPDQLGATKLWCSIDIYKALNKKKYKGYKIYTHHMMPEKEYAFITEGSAFHK